jgi:hypothetical protein
VKSHVSTFLELAEHIYYDATAKCSAQVFQKRDLLTIRSRIKHEGISFLTITLPDFAKDFERSLEEGRIDPMFFRNFRKHKAIPAFLRGMLSQLFDVETGRLFHEINDAGHENQCRARNSRSTEFPRDQDDPRPHCEESARVGYLGSTIVEAIRSITRAFAKVKLDCSIERTAAAIKAFEETEQWLLEAGEQEVELLESKELSDASFYLWAPVLSSISLDRIRCSHGPGSTVEGISPNGKYRWTAWPARLEPYFPFLDSCFTIGAWDHQDFKKVASILPEQEQPVKVVTVPKTLRSPRVIAIEPVAMQYTQQGIRRELYARLEATGPTAGQINFTDQSVNQRMALRSSTDRSFVTIDLSEASDRVPRSLALSMFQWHPDLRDAIDACTSKNARLPDGRVIPLRKFASMGNALCFPVEAMYFYTICVIAIAGKLNLPMSFETCRKVSKLVFVYGDDIIVPTDFADAVLNNLQKYFCKVNRNKTFLRGYFRESCGVDAFAGYDVTPTYLRELPPENHRQAKRLISWTKTANLFYLRGYWRASEFLYSRVERIVGKLPYVQFNSSALGRVTFKNATTIERWNDKLHRFEFRGLVSSPVYRTDRLDGYAALAKCLLTSSEDRDTKHLERSALHGEAALRRRWVPSF